MIEYEVCEINKDHYLKLLKCTSKSLSHDNTTVKPQRKPVIVIIPGNPGIIDFYEQFARELNALTNFDIIGISHTGHMFDDSVKSWQPIDTFSQVNDKVKFLNNYFMTSENDVNNNGEPPEIFFIGHSFGCFVILEILTMLNSDIKKRVKHSYMLFPMMERIRETPNGKVLCFATKYLMSFLYLIAYLLTFLPQFIQKSVIDFGFAKRHPKNNLHDGLTEVIHRFATSFSSVRSSLHLGRDEMDKVRNLNTHSVNQNYEKLTFYYGTKDQWVPLDFHQDMKYYITDLYEKNGKKNRADRVILDECEPPLEHAFVIFKKQTNIISQLVAAWITNLNEEDTFN